MPSSIRSARWSARRALALLAMLSSAMLPLVAWAQPAAGAAPERVLTDAQWRADLDQALAALREIHPDPFRSVEEDAFDAAAGALQEEIPALDDQAIVVRLTELIALLRDGHTRVFLPRQHHELAPELEMGHSGTDPPAHPKLELAQLPVRLELFSDGVFVVAATAEHRELVGRRVVGVGDAPVEEALEAAGRTIAAGSPSRLQFLSGDRLSLPAVLRGAGLSDSLEKARFTLSAGGEATRVTLRALERGEVEWIGRPASPPLAARRPDDAAWFEVLPERSAIYVHVDELEAFPERPWSEFVRRSLEAARSAGVPRYVLDLRANAGGNGSWVTPFVSGLSGSEFDRYGRLMVLIGGGTYSAAQMLVNQLERYTAVCFVGEPSGSPPTHFGDSRKIILENSGLTLRVSTLFWPNWLAGEFREATSAHVDAVPSSADYFSGRDTALEAALSYAPPGTVAAQVEDLLRRGKVQAGILRFLAHLTDPRTIDFDTDSFVAAGHRLLDDRLTRVGRFVFVLVGDYHPASAAAQAGWGRAMELEGDPAAAADHYERALALDPDHPAARRALARLRPHRSRPESGTGYLFPGLGPESGTGCHSNLSPIVPRSQNR